MRCREIYGRYTGDDGEIQGRQRAHLAIIHVEEAAALRPGRAAAQQHRALGGHLLRVRVRVRVRGRGRVRVRVRVRVRCSPRPPERALPSGPCHHPRHRRHRHCRHRHHRRPPRSPHLPPPPPPRA